MRYFLCLVLAGCSADITQPWLMDPFVAGHVSSVDEERRYQEWLERLPSPDAHEALRTAPAWVEGRLLVVVMFGSPDRTTAAIAVLEARRVPKLARLLVERWGRVVETGSRMAVADAFARLVDGSVAAEVGWFLDRESEVAVRARLARALGTFADARGVDALGRAAVHPSPLLAHEAVKALGAIGSPRAVVPLLAALEVAGTDESLAAAAIRGLSRLRARGAVAALTSRLGGSPYRRVREECAIALGAIGDAKAVLPLIDALTDPSWSVFRECEAALTKITGAKVTVAPGDDLQRRTQEEWRKGRHR